MVARLAFLVLPFCLTALPAQGQVTIAPTTLVIDEQSRFGTLQVLNGSGQTQEVHLDFVFGYPAADESGRIYMEYEDGETEARSSMAEWIRAFPRRFTLEAGARQTVRFTVRPPENLPQGTYWTRIKITSHPPGRMIDEEVQSGVSAQIRLRFEQVIADFFTKGRATTGVVIHRAEVNVEDGLATVLASIERTGDSPFLGTVSLTVRDSDGHSVYEGSTPVAVYSDGMRRIEFDTSAFPPGDYSVDLLFRTARGDMRAADLVQAEPVTASATFAIER